MTTIPPQGASGPLTGVRVLGFGTLIAGPFAGRLLADMGADVIKIEGPGRPDPLRDWGAGQYQGRSLWWPVQSRNKRCVTIDLASDRGRSLLLELVSKSDVVLENFRPGALEKLDLAYARLAEVNQGLVLVRVSGYGQTGPYAERAGYASVAEAMGGLRYLNGFPDQPPPRLGISLGDSLAALFAVQGVLAALHARTHILDGRGQVVDVSLMESCFALLESAVPEYDRLGLVREPTGTGLRGIAPSNIFRSSDGAWMVIAANQDTLFRKLCTAMGRSELADDPRFATHLARGAHQEEIEGVVAAWAGEHDAQTIDRVLNEAGVVCGPLYTIADIFGDPQYAAREMLVECSDAEFGTYVAPGVVPKFSETPGAVRWSAPWELGADNEAVFGELLGLSAEDVDRLAADGVV